MESLKHLEKHYMQACEKLFLPNDLYQFDLEKKKENRNSFSGRTTIESASTLKDLEETS